MMAIPEIRECMPPVSQSYPLWRQLAYRWRRVGAMAVLLGGWAVSPLAAQTVRKSQPGMVQQQIAGTTVTVAYSRPVARGRTLFGGIVPWGKIWNPGADTATAITVSTPVRVNDQPLAAGSYSIWTEPQQDRWIVIFSRAHPVFHDPYPKGKDALRLTVIPRAGEHMETLAFYFPLVEAKGAELVLHWGNVVVPLVIAVP